LQSTDSGNVIGIERIDQGSDADQYVARAATVIVQLVPSRLVQEHVDVVVLIHSHRGHVSPVGLRERRSGRFGEVENREAVQRIPVQADNGLP
jgi:L-ascorbate metabolism protein UlaG (beta-lactamase superfamily)